MLKKILIIITVVYVVGSGLYSGDDAYPIFLTIPFITLIVFAYTLYKRQKESEKKLDDLNEKLNILLGDNLPDKFKSVVEEPLDGEQQSNNIKDSD